MSGPNESGPNESGLDEGGPRATTSGDFTLPLFKPDAPQSPSERFRLKLFWDTPRLQWTPDPGRPAPPREPEFLKLDDPRAALGSYKSYLQGGGLRFDLSRARFDLLDKAYLDAPTDPPTLIPSFAQLKAMEDEAFFKRLGRPAPLLGAPLPAPTLTPPLSAAPGPSPFFKLPDPAAMRGDPPAPKPGALGDVAKAFLAVPAINRNFELLKNFGLQQVNLLEREWDKAPWRDRITAIVIFAPLPAEIVRDVLGNDEARHFAFDALKGQKVPIPFLSALSFHIDGFGKANSYFLGSKPGDAQELKFGLTLDVLKAFPNFAKKF